MRSSDAHKRVKRVTGRRPGSRSTSPAVYSDELEISDVNYMRVEHTLSHRTLRSRRYVRTRKHGTIIIEIPIQQDWCEIDRASDTWKEFPNE